jgi:ribosomal protein S12 methylthiotransferase
MQSDTILPYLDVPFQHASDSVLKAMRRPAADARTLERIATWRESVPDLTIRSTFIVGFPGETDADFEHLLEWLDTADLDRVGCFKYEPVAGATANALPGTVPEDVKEERWHRLMSMQRAISARRLAAKTGTTIPVIIDALSDDGAIGRSMGDAPEIDGNVFVAGERLTVGSIVNVRVTHSDDYDLWATTVDIETSTCSAQ